MPDPRRQKGDRGEDLAARFLEKRGYKILARNHRTRLGELDIIAKKDGVLVFVEVKTRHSTRFGPAKAAVTFSKQNKISALALEYLARTGQTRKKARFDVVAVDLAQGEPRSELIENAFNLVFS